MPALPAGFRDTIRNSLATAPARAVISAGETFLRELGHILIFARQMFYWAGHRPFRWRQILGQLEFIGVDSLPIIALTGVFVGMVFGLQTGYGFRLFNAENLVGSTVGLSLTREIAPVFTALMLTARTGSSMAAELGSMRVTEQIDALETMAVNPIQFLVVPRVIAATVMAPILCAIFSFIGIIGAYFVSTRLLAIDGFYFLNNMYYHVDPTDVLGGLIKATAFGFLLSLISCHRGYHTSGGSKGVGLSTTQAVVISSVVILITDYFLTAWILEIWPDV